MHRYIIFALLLFITGCGQRQVDCFATLAMTSDDTTHPPTAEWIEGNTESDGRVLQTLVLHNVPEGSRVWFQELYDGKIMVEGPEMHHYQGTSVGFGGSFGPFSPRGADAGGQQQKE